MPLVIGLGFYGYTTLTGQHYLAADIMLFLIAVVAGQLVSYQVIIKPKINKWKKICSISIIFLLTFAFTYFSFTPPKLFLFRDSGTQNYGIPEGQNTTAGDRD